MSVTSVTHGLLPAAYGLTERPPQRITPEANDSQAAAGSRGKSVARESAALPSSHSATDLETLENSRGSLALALKANRLATRGSTEASADSTGKQSSRAAALYKQVSQMGSSDPATSALLHSWNHIMQSGNTPASESSSLHLTA